MLMDNHKSTYPYLPLPSPPPSPQYAQAVSDRDDMEAQVDDVKSELKLEKVGVQH
jgi:hypothetical protein